MSSSASSSSPSGSPPSPGHRRRSFLGRSLWNSSTFSVASIATFNSVLPEYSAVDAAGGPPEFEDNSTFFSTDAGTASPLTMSPPASPTSRSPAFPNSYWNPASRYTYMNPVYSEFLTSSTAASVDVGKDSYFQDSFPIRQDKAWATLHLFSRKSIPGNPQPLQHRPKAPRFWSSDPVAGVLDLNLDSAQSIQQITLKIRGKIITSSFEGGTHTFLDHETILWSKNSTEKQESLTSTKSKSDGKLIGEHHFPFTFPFPANVDLSSCSSIPSEWSLGPPASPPASPTISPSSSKGSSRTWSLGLGSPSSPKSPQESSHTGQKQKRRQSSLPKGVTAATDEDGTTSIVCPCPQSYMEHDAAASVQYELSVHIVHGRFRQDSKIKTNITYIPSTTPLPASSKRQAAYEEGALLPGPSSDPLGWFALPKTAIHGEISSFGRRQVQIDCVLYLANPLSYTRDTSIPCYLTLSSDDATALDTLTSSTAPYVRLVRRLKYFCPQGGIAGSAVQDSNLGTAGGAYCEGIMPVAVDPSGKGSSLISSVHEVSVGVWRLPPKDVLQQTYIRHLEGEIHIHPDMQPSCICTIFSIEYSVEVLPLRVGAFEPVAAPGVRGKARNQVLVSQIVEIATLHRQDQPVPIPFTEPSKARMRPIVE
ncbi:hypothetical protein B0H34DRAFT_794105 [Crassisporium funariophilum]|nr:hypothetical protein B0H34DRAFT_794105 [Crassisporium funariophilum]